MIVYRKECPNCRTLIALGPWDVMGARGPAWVRCPFCGDKTSLSLGISLFSGLMSIAVCVLVASTYLERTEDWLGKPIGMLPFLGMFAIGIPAFVLTRLVFTSSCYLLYSAVRSSS